MTSEKLKKARQYEAHTSQYISAEERPAYHISPYVGWLNDPNGFCFYQRKYHQFYQYHPYNAKWGPMHWGHAVSRDMVKWEYLPCAMAPDMPFDERGCFSGSAVELADGRMLLMYTGVSKKQKDDGTWVDIQTQCMAVGDGMEFEKYSGNPVLDAADVPAGFDDIDFRDPKLWQEPDGRFACVVVNRTDDNSAAVLRYRSADGFSWKLDSILDRCRNALGQMWECPDYFSLDGKMVLLVGAMDMRRQGLELHAGNSVLCIIGTEENGVLQRQSVQSVDYGIDLYATQTLLTPDGRRIMTAWMQNPDTTNGHRDDQKWFGQMILPRELSVADGRLIQTPIRELEGYRGEKVSYENVELGAELSLPGISGRVLDMTLEIAPAQQGYRLFTLKTAVGEGLFASLTYSPDTNILTIDRSYAGSRKAYVHSSSCYVRDRQGRLKLRILLDRFSMEVFANDGEQAMTVTLMDTPLTADGITFAAEGTAVLDVEKYDLNL